MVCHKKEYQHKVHVCALYVFVLCVCCVCVVCVVCDVTGYLDGEFMISSDDKSTMYICGMCVSCVICI